MEIACDAAGSTRCALARHDESALKPGLRPTQFILSDALLKLRRDIQDAIEGRLCALRSASCIHRHHAAMKAARVTRSNRVAETTTLAHFHEEAA